MRAELDWSQGLPENVLMQWSEFIRADKELSEFIRAEFITADKDGFSHFILCGLALLIHEQCAF